MIKSFANGIKRVNKGPAGNELGNEAAFTEE